MNFVTLKSALTIVFLCFVTQNECARILCYFNIGLYSRHVVFRALARELADRGHEVVVITSLPQSASRKETVGNLTEIDVSPVLNDTNDDAYSDIQLIRNKNPIEGLNIVLDSILREFERQLQVKAFKDVIREKKKYDLLIVESMTGSPGLVLSHIFQVPAILIRTNVPVFREIEIVSSDAHTQFLYLTGNKLKDLTLWDTVNLLHHDHHYHQVYLEKELYIDKILKRNFGPDIPLLAELRKNVQAVLVNVHWSWDYNRPVPPNMVYLGNIVQRKANELPKNIQTYLDASVHGVIYLSFGSIFDFTALPEAQMKMFFNVFSLLPYDVLLKCKKQLPGVPENVKIYNWVPQTDVLRHPKIKLFITQGGFHSTDEAISAGVPMLGVPMFSDQWHNVEQCVKFHIGVQVDLNQLTEEMLLSAFTTVLNDSSYATSTRKLRSQLQQRYPPMERAVLTVERVLRVAAQAHVWHTRETFPELPLLAVAALLLLALPFFVFYSFKLLLAQSKKIIKAPEYTLEYFKNLLKWLIKLACRFIFSLTSIQTT